MTAAVEAEPTAAEWTYPYEPLPKQLQAHQIDVDELLYGGAAGGGKLLAHDTPVLTTGGWKRHGDLVPGDFVFGHDGRPVRVLASYSPPTASHFLITFSTGETIRAGREHLWTVQTAADRQRLARSSPEYRARRRASRASRAVPNPSRGPVQSAAVTARNIASAAAARSGEAAPDPWDFTRVVESHELAALVRSERRAVSVPHAGPIDAPGRWEGETPPWVLGVWLGDGTLRSDQITHGAQDRDALLHQMERNGYVLRREDRGKHYWFRTPDGVNLSRALTADLGRPAVRQKRIPAFVFTAPHEDRLALLQGLVDSDGHVNDRGQVELSFSDAPLAADVARLLATLGVRVTPTAAPAWYRGKRCRDRHRMKFTTALPAATYPRRGRALSLPAGRGTPRADAVYITDVVEVPADVPANCIQVEDARSTYLAGDTLIPTHNSEFLLADAVMFALLVPRSKSILFRTSLPEIEQELEPRLRERVPEAIGRYNGAKHVMRFYNGSTLRFAYLERPGDVYRYTGAEYQRIYFDEATTFDPSNYTFMKSRLRAAGAVLARMEELGLRPAIKSTTNPGGRGHVFFKERFVDPAPPGTVLEDTETGLTRAFIASAATDNPHLNTSYHQFLSALDPQLRKALRDGDWNLLDGVRFSQWRELAHVVTPEEYPIDLTGVPRVVGVDYGVADPYAAVWCALMPDGTVVVYREAGGTDMTASEQAEAILQAEGPEERAPGRPLPVVADRSMWNRTGRSGAKRADSDVPDRGSIAWEYYERFGRDLRRSVSDRKAGWALIDELLRLRPCDGSCGDDECMGHPRLVIYNTCRNLIKDLPSLPRSRRDPEDAETTGVNDHFPDALRYALMELVARPPLRTKPNSPLGSQRKPRPVTSSVRRMGF